MVLKIVLGVVIGVGAGFVLSFFTRGIGSS